MNNQMPFMMPNPGSINPFNQNEQIKTLEIKVNNIERELRRLENKIERMEHNNYPMIGNSSANYKTDSYNMF